MTASFLRPLVESADGLPDGFTIGQEKTISPPSANDVKNIVTGIPEKMVEKFGTPEQIAEAKKAADEAAKKEALAKKPRRKKPVKKAIQALKPEDKKL